MAYCYEFGTQVKDGCGHAMSVVPEGGSCTCLACGASCTGLFSGCAAIVKKGGYMPILAPRWATSGKAGNGLAVKAETPPPVAPVLAPVPPVVAPTDAAPEPAPVGGLEEVRSLLVRLVEETSADALAQLERGMAARDAELSATFDRLVGSQMGLASLVNEVKEGQDDVVALLRAIEARVGAMESDAATRSTLRSMLRRIG